MHGHSAPSPPPPGGRAEAEWRYPARCSRASEEAVAEETTPWHKTGERAAWTIRREPLAMMAVPPERWYKERDGSLTVREDERRE
jgi:hypothetical protein